MQEDREEDRRREERGKGGRGEEREGKRGEDARSGGGEMRRGREGRGDARGDERRAEESRAEERNTKEGRFDPVKATRVQEKNNFPVGESQGLTPPTSDKGYNYDGTLDGLYQPPLIATGTRLRPVEATFLRHILATKPAKHIRV